MICLCVCVGVMDDWDRKSRNKLFFHLNSQRGGGGVFFFVFFFFFFLGGGGGGVFSFGFSFFFPLHTATLCIYAL